MINRTRGLKVFFWDKKFINPLSIEATNLVLSTIWSKSLRIKSIVAARLSLKFSSAVESGEKENLGTGAFGKMQIEWL